jgi:hypothetical protein
MDTKIKTTLLKILLCTKLCSSPLLCACSRPSCSASFCLHHPTHVLGLPLSLSARMYDKNIPFSHLMAIPEHAKSHALRTILQGLAGKNTDNTIKKNVKEMLLLKTVDANIEPEEESARRWEMGQDLEHVEVHEPSTSESGREPGCSLFGSKGSDQHPAKTEPPVDAQESPALELYSRYFPAIDGLTPKSTCLTLKPGS